MAAFEAFCKTWKTLTTLFPDPERDGSRERVALMMNAYYQGLMDLDDEAIRVAAMRHATSSVFFPKLAELRRLATDGVSVNIPSAEEAWLETRKAMRKHGIYKRPTFESEVIAKAVETIGWDNLCNSENEVADRAHFFRIYEHLADRCRESARALPEVRAYLESKRAGALDAPRSIGKILSGFSRPAATGGEGGE